MLLGRKARAGGCRLGSPLEDKSTKLKRVLAPEDLAPGVVSLNDAGPACAYWVGNVCAEVRHCLARMSRCGFGVVTARGDWLSSVAQRMRAHGDKL